MNVPPNVLNKFIQIAKENYIDGGQVETLCYFLGQNREVDTIIFPKQEGTESRVIDIGKLILCLNIV